ncbi:uncharacterized protein LOC125547383 [Triticum urartu]|uniref:uncharacterized protein LOC125547383 n=1 Tax=Triticum urartu TaxID=4572 RepID=UPI002044A9AD|nr:uncharacterized protein LOC125547383 [Triticum urartu]
MGHGRTFPASRWRLSSPQSWAQDWLASRWSSTTPSSSLFASCNQHHCADAVSRGHLRGTGHRIYVREWRLEAHADNEDQLHHVCLCLEGVPIHGWNNYIATFLIACGCSLDYIEQRSRHKEDTRDLALWAWTANPNAIPKVKWLTLPARGHRCRGRRGLRHRVLIHLDLHEDHSKAGDDDDNPPPPDVHEFTWYRKVVDGTFVPRERHPAQGCAERRADRREDDGDRDGRRGREGGRPWEGWGTRSDARFPATRVSASARGAKTAPETGPVDAAMTAPVLLLWPPLWRVLPFCGDRARAVMSRSAPSSSWAPMSRGGLTLQKVKRSGTPVVAMASKAAKKLVCRMMGITKNGEDVTEAILDEFTAKFKEQLAPEVILAMREFFHLDDSAVNDVEDALIDHGGTGALELAQDGVAAQDNQGSQPSAA